VASPVNIEARIFVDRPPEVVFDTVAYPFAGPQWELRAGHRLVTEGGLRVGARAEVTAEDDMTLVEEVIELERPSVLATRNLSGPVDIVARWTVEPSEGGTRLTRLTTMGRSKARLMRIVLPFTMRRIEREGYEKLRRQNQALLHRLKAALESEAGPAGPGYP
jgi:uncharacterized protein YndB with AHSA1/START domain